MRIIYIYSDCDGRDRNHDGDGDDVRVANARAPFVEYHGGHVSFSHGLFFIVLDVVLVVRL